MSERTDAAAPAGEDATGTGGGLLRRAGGWPYRVFLTLALGFGIVGVTRVWWAALGMWKDEAGIANNLRRDYLALTGHLKYDQVAPVGWLWLEKTLVEVIGPGDRVLRLPAFVGALAVLCLGTLVARRAIGRLGAVAVAGLLAVSPVLLVYAGELKQYTWEAGIALALILLGAWAYETLRWRGLAPVLRRPWPVVAWVAATGVAVFVSYSAILVVAGVTAALMCLHALRRSWADAGWLAALTAPAGATAAFLVYRRHQFSFYPGQTDYFRGGTAPAGAGPGEFLSWLPFMWSRFVIAPMSWGWPWLVLLLAVIGVVAMWRRNRLWAAMLLMVFLAALGGAAVRGYPMVSRPAIYLIAPTVLLVVAGVEGLLRATATLLRQARATPRLRVPAVAAAVAMLAVLVGAAAMVRPVAGTVRKEVAQPLGKEALRDALANVAPQLRPGDKLLVYYFGNAVTTWYAPLLGIENEIYHVRLCQPNSPDTKETGLYEKLAGAERVFYVQGRLNATTRRDNFQVSLQALDAMGTIQEQHDAPRDRIGPHSWALVDIDQVPPVPRPGPDDPCLELY